MVEGDRADGEGDQEEDDGYGKEEKRRSHSRRKG
jgi:hypothetical protein